MNAPDSLSRQYQRRFSEQEEYRKLVWIAIIQKVLNPYLRDATSVLDLGCGWGEFINNVDFIEKRAMDLNPDTASHLEDGIEFLHQNCASPWPLPDDSLDLVFSSNFLEHLPDKQHIEDTLDEVFRCLKPGGRCILIGPNIRFLPGEYWDFWDHHVPLSDRSLVEILELKGMNIERCVPRFLPYTMSDGRNPPVALVKLFLSLPIFWPALGKQFLIVAQK